MKSFFLILAICLSIVADRSQASEKHGHTALSFLETRGDTINRSWFNNRRRSYSRQGDFFIQVGFNWSSYGKSDINFDGPGYDFTLEDVKANDQPYKGSLQYNIHAGYFITDNYSLSLGYDHMKYVMKIPQQLIMSGVIEAQVSSPSFPSGPYAGNYNSQSINVTPELVTLEYTDGFNYINARIQRFDDIWVSVNARNSLALESGVGLGLIMPRADVKLFGVGMNNKLNVAGWGASAKAGLMFNFNKNIYFMASLEAGYANMDKIFTTGRNDFDKASQKLNFVQNTYLIGLRF